MIYDRQEGSRFLLLEKFMFMGRCVLYRMLNIPKGVSAYRNVPLKKKMKFPLVLRFFFVLMSQTVSDVQYSSVRSQKLGVRV